MSSFGERLKELRKFKGLSQKALAECLDVSKSSINMYEHSVREPSLDMLETIADFFNCDIDYLLGKSNIVNRLQYNAFVDSDFPALSDHEKQVISRYRANPAMQPAIDKLLGLENEEIINKKDA